MNNYQRKKNKEVQKFMEFYQIPQYDFPYIRRLFSLCETRKDTGNSHIFHKVRQMKIAMNKKEAE